MNAIFCSSNSLLAFPELPSRSCEPQCLDRDSFTEHICCAVFHIYTSGNPHSGFQSLGIFNVTDESVSLYLTTSLSSPELSLLTQVHIFLYQSFARCRPAGHTACISYTHGQPRRKASAPESKSLMESKSDKGKGQKFQALGFHGLNTEYLSSARSVLENQKSSGRSILETSSLQYEPTSAYPWRSHSLTHSSQLGIRKLPRPKFPLVACQNYSLHIHF